MCAAEGIDNGKASGADELRDILGVPDDGKDCVWWIRWLLGELLWVLQMLLAGPVGVAVPRSWGV